jgi:hypothetical protein
MGFFQRFIPPNDRYAALMLYGMVFSTCFNGYDAGMCYFAFIYQKEVFLERHSKLGS